MARSAASEALARGCIDHFSNIFPMILNFHKIDLGA